MLFVPKGNLLWNNTGTPVTLTGTAMVYLLKKFVLILLTALLVPVVAAEQLLQSAGQEEPVFIESITYGLADGVELQLNIALPAESMGAADRYPMIIFIHGGGWQTGHRNAYNGRIKTTAQRGYVAATIAHRLTAVKDANGRPLYPWPAAIHDCKAAIRFLKTHAAEYHIDPNRVGVTGASSGGHLSLMLGLTSVQDGLEGTIPMPETDLPVVTDTRIQAVFNKSGPTEMVSCHAAPIVTPFFEDLLGKPDENPSGYREASPVTYLTKDDPPVMTIHGTQDHVVPVEQAQLLDKRMNAAGLRHELLALDGQKHIFTRDYGSVYWDAVYAFFDKYLKQAEEKAGE